MTPAPRSRHHRPILALLLLLLGAAPALAQQNTDGLDYVGLLALADAAPSVALAERALERAERQASATAVPFDLTLSAGYDRRFGTVEAGEGIAPEDLAGGDVAPIALTARIDPALLGPGADELASAVDAVAAARDDLAAARRSARIDAVQAFQEALQAETAAALARQESDLARREADAVQQRSTVGAASELAVAEAALAASRAEQALAAAERERALALRALRSVLGREVAAPIGLLPAPPERPEPPGDASSARPDVRAALRAVEDADRTAAAQRRQAWPVVTVDANVQIGDDARTARFGASVDNARFAPTLNASFDPDDGVPGVGPDGSSRSFQIGIRAEIPFSPAVPHALAAVGIAQDQARARQEAAREQADLAVDRAYAAVRDAEERAQLADRAADLAAEALAVELLRSEAGSASDASVQRAELDLQRSRLDAARATDRHRLATFRLFDALALPPETLE
ncbi:MAG: TolC family protein [Trueperaceae bacterium]